MECLLWTLSEYSFHNVSIAEMNASLWLALWSFISTNGLKATNSTVSAEFLKRAGAEVNGKEFLLKDSVLHCG